MLNEAAYIQDNIILSDLKVVMEKRWPLSHLPSPLYVLSQLPPEIMILAFPRQVLKKPKQSTFSVLSVRKLGISD